MESGSWEVVDLLSFWWKDLGRFDLDSTSEGVLSCILKEGTALLARRPVEDTLRS